MNHHVRARALLFVFVVACGKKEAAPSDPIASSATASASASAAVVIGAPGGGNNAEPRTTLDAAEIPVPPGKSQLHVAWGVPNGTAINDDAPIAVRWQSSDGLVASPTDIKGHGKDIANGFDIPIELFAGASGGQLIGDLDLVVCDVETHSVCVPIKRRVELTFAVVKNNASGRVTLPLPKAKP